VSSVVVVGGGVIGAACAHYLARDGWRVTVVDRGRFGGACSHANCGFVCPSHVLPLAGPGAIRNALRALLAPYSPFAIRPRLDPALWGWLYHFACRCNRRDWLETGLAVQALLNSSRRLYDELMRQEAFDCEWETRGLLYVLRDRRGMEHFAETARLLREQFGLEAERYDGDAVSDLEPALKPGLGGGFLYRTDAHLRPDRLLASWQAGLQAQGVTIREGCAVEGFVRDRRTARAVRTSEGDVQADAFVVAAGAWTPWLARHLGCRIPIQPGKGYSITMPRPARCPQVPLIFEEHRVAVTPFRSGYRLGSTLELAGYDHSLNRRRLGLLRRGAAHYLHEPWCGPVEEEWFGLRPMTPDGKPIIGRSPALANVWIAAGHNMLGVSMAPATGKLVAELLGGRPPHVDPAPFAVGRH
jgi:D-amino-acid dehydrogenase